MDPARRTFGCVCGTRSLPCTRKANGPGRSTELSKSSTNHMFRGDPERENVLLLTRKCRGGRKRPRIGAGFEPPALLFLDQIKRDKGVWWMPWQQEAMKDVVHCEKPWGAVNRP